MPVTQLLQVSVVTFTLKWKFRTLFVVMVAAFAGLGLFATSRLGEVNGAADEMAETWLPRGQIVGELNTKVAIYRVTEARHIMSDAPSP